MLLYAHFYKVLICIVFFSVCLCITLRKAHHIKDDQKTMGKHIRKARKCDRADSLLHSHSTMCISLSHYTLSFTSFPPFLCFFFSLSLTHTYTTCHCYHIKHHIHLLCMSDRKHIFSRGDIWNRGLVSRHRSTQVTNKHVEYEKPGVSLSVCQLF